MVGAGKDRSGFHGTTIQAVYSKPSEKNLQVELVSAGFVSLLSAGSSRTAIETKFDFSVSLSDEKRYVLRFGKIICLSFDIKYSW
jgi:hypothetical protein